MSRKLIIVLAVLFLSTTAFAQKQGDLRGTLYTTNPSGGVGVGLAYWVGSQLSIELSTAVEQHSASRTIVIDGDLARVESFDYSSNPVDFLVQYHIPTATIDRWKPYVGVGARYVKRPDESPDTETNAAISPELNGGVFYHLQPRLALRFDVRQLLRGDTPPYDDSAKFAFGVVWRF